MASGQDSSDFLQNAGLAYFGLQLAQEELKMSFREISFEIPGQSSSDFVHVAALAQF